MLNLVWLKSFTTLVAHRSFQAAAASLGIAQPTLTQHIQKLEDHLAVTLIRRGKQGCEATAPARLLLPVALSMLRLEEQATAVVQGKRLRVGASSNIGIYLLPPRMRSFLAQARGMDVDLVIESNPDIASRMTNGELDVALMEWWHPCRGFRSEAWKREPLVLIVPPDHPYAEWPEVDRATLAGLSLIGGEAGTGTGRVLADFFGSQGPFPRVSMRLGSTEAVKQAVRAGLGVSLVLAAAVSEEVRTGTLKAIPVTSQGLEKSLQVIVPEAVSEQPALAVFINHLCHWQPSLPAP